MLMDPIAVLDADALDLVGLLWQPSSSGTRQLFNGDRESKLGHEAYCDYFRRQWHILALYGDRQHAASRSPQAIARLIEHIRDGKPREEMMDMLRLAGGEEEACERSLNLAIRLFVMMRFGLAKHQLSPRRFLRWEQGSLQAFIHGLFNVVPKLSCEQIRLPKSFDAWSIANIGGIEIAFTDNMADHLLLVDDDTRLLIFHHASFLEYHRR